MRRVSNLYKQSCCCADITSEWLLRWEVTELLPSLMLFKWGNIITLDLWSWFTLNAKTSCYFTEVDIKAKLICCFFLAWKQMFRDAKRGFFCSQFWVLKAFRVLQLWPMRFLTDHRLSGQRGTWWKNKMTDFHWCSSSAWSLKFNQWSHVHSKIFPVNLANEMRS